MKIYTPNKPILEKKWYQFLAPHYWPLWLVFLLLRLCTCLPYTVLLKLGKIIGYMAMQILKKRRRITEINLRLCFPELNSIEIKKLLKKNFCSVGIGILEMALAWWASDKRLRKLVLANGLENLQAAIANKRGILLLSYHFTCIELSLRLISLYAPVSVMYRPQNNKFFEWMLQRARRHYVAEGIHRLDVRSMLRHLYENKIVVYTPDQDYGREGSVFAPFFGVPANTVMGTARFIKKTGSIVLPLFYYHDLTAKKYSLDFLAALENFPSNDQVENATRINKILETGIRQHPEQYIWQHRRFKNVPGGQQAPY